MEKLLKKIGTELGVKLSPTEDTSRFPADFSAFNEAYKLEDLDVAKMLKTAKKLATSYPDLPEAQHRLISLLLIADKRSEAKKLLKSAIDKFPDDISLAATYITMQESPEASLAEGFRLGTPPDLNRFRPQPDGSYNIEDYLSFELCALRLDIAANRVPSLWQRMERLLSLRVQEEVVLENIDFYFNHLVQQEIAKGKLLPEQWKVPAVASSLPLTKALISECWEEFKAEFMREVEQEIGLNLFDGQLAGLMDFFGGEKPPLKAVKGGGKRRKKAKGKQVIYQLKITLEGIRPPVWRRLLVPADIELAGLHTVIQDAFDWWDYHLHQFEYKGEYFALPDPFNYDDEYATDYRGLQLNDLLLDPKDRLRYEYDFGDSWHHLIVLEKILPVQPGQTYPFCVTGKRSRPPEDVGGVWGYANFLEIINNPDHEEYKEILEWAGGAFDPEAFDADEINAGWV